MGARVHLNLISRLRNVSVWHCLPVCRRADQRAQKEVPGFRDPWLVVLDREGNLVANEADTDVPKGPEAFKEWLVKAKVVKAA